jgi:hypothetical protein
MKPLVTLTAAAALCGATMVSAPAQALSDQEKAALAALAIIGLGIAAAKHGDRHDSTSEWDDGRYGEPFSPSPGIVCPPRPEKCYQDGMISWRWTRRIFGG